MELKKIRRIDSAGPIRESTDAAASSNRIPESMEQDIRFCTTGDGVRIAYSVCGQGPPLVRVLGWFTHLEMEWDWPDLRFFWEKLARNHTMIRYDGRGMGLSDRDVGAFTEETRALDLDAVLEAVGVDQTDLIGISEGGWTAAAYAVQHPRRMSHLILYGAYARGSTARPGYDREEDDALVTLMRKHWGRESPAFRQMFTSQFFPEGSRPELIAHFNEMQRSSADPETAARYLKSCHSRGDGHHIFPKITTPTLVVHRRGDMVTSFEEGRYMASVIPGAKFMPLSGISHYFPSDQPETIELVEAINRFLGR